MKEIAFESYVEHLCEMNALHFKDCPNERGVLNDVCDVLDKMAQEVPFAYLRGDGVIVFNEKNSPPPQIKNWPAALNWTMWHGEHHEALRHGWLPLYLNPFQSLPQQTVSPQLDLAIQGQEYC